MKVNCLKTILFLLLSRKNDMQFCSFQIRYGTVMGGLLSEKFLDANVSIPFMGPSLDTPSLKKYKQVLNYTSSCFSGLLGK